MGKKQDEAKARLLRQMQHPLEHLLRWRYGPRRERVDENQLFLFAAELASPLVELMQQRVLSSKAVQTDDTPVPVLDPELPRTGFLQADAYSSYDQLYTEPERGVVEVACWARGALWARRKSYEAQSSDVMRSNWEALVRYCEDGDLEIDNNGAERSLRGVLARISGHPHNRLEELLPDRWAAARPAQSSWPSSSPPSSPARKPPPWVRRTDTPFNEGQHVLVDLLGGGELALGCRKDRHAAEVHAEVVLVGIIFRDDLDFESICSSSGDVIVAILVAVAQAPVEIGHLPPESHRHLRRAQLAVEEKTSGRFVGHARISAYSEFPEPSASQSRFPSWAAHDGLGDDRAHSPRLDLPGLRLARAISHKGVRRIPVELRL